MLDMVAPIGGVVSMDINKDTLLKIKNNINNIPIDDIKEIMGINELKPIDGTDSVKRAVDENGDYFKEWYEDELRQRFEEFIEKSIQRFS